MEKLSKALSEVDRKVEGLKGKFERTTMEAAKLKLELEKAQETIDAAENLVGKLEGEYRRWSGQVGGLFKYEKRKSRFSNFSFATKMVRGYILTFMKRHLSALLTWKS